MKIRELFNSKLRHINTDALSILPVPPDLTEERKRKVWEYIGSMLRESIKNKGKVVVINACDYSDIPYEELKYTLELQGYKLMTSCDTSFEWDDYHCRYNLHIRW